MRIVPLFKMKFSRTSGLLAAFAGLFASTASAQLSLPWTESFSYPSGQRLGVTGTESAAVWTIGSTGSSADCVTIQDSAALSYTGLEFAAGSRGALIGTTTSTRNKGARFTTTSAGKLYNSFLLNVQTMPSSGDRIFACLSTSTGGSTSMGNPSATVWLSSSGQLKISKASTQTPAATHPTVLTPNTTYLVVTRYDFDVSPHQFALWVNPATNTFGGVDPNNPDVSSTASTDQGPLSSFWFAHTDSMPQITAAVDEIRLGTSWAAVTPQRSSVPSKLAFSTQPSDAAVNAAINPSVVVQVQDNYGEAKAVAGIPVTVSMLVGGTLNGTTTQNTDANGKATFNNLSLSTRGVVNVLRATSPNYTNSTSGLFEIYTSGGVPNSPLITQTLRTPTSVVLRGSGGDAGQPFQVLAANSVLTPRSSWSVAGTFNFDGTGKFDCTNAVSPGSAMQLYCLKPTGTGTGGGVSGGAPHGFATASANVTGGGKSPVYIVTNAASLVVASNNPNPAVCLIMNNLTLSSSGNFYLGANKTLIGVGNDITIQGCMALYGTFDNDDVTSPCTNVIIRNLRFTNPTQFGEDDGVVIKNGARDIWVDHCSFFDIYDGALDVTEQSDNVTVSWCRFFYNSVNAHNDTVNLIGGDDESVGDAGTLHVTMHHNWYGQNCIQRMPSVRYGRVHVYNNFFNSPGNIYCVRTRLNAEVLTENNYFLGVNNPVERLSTTGTPGRMTYTNNITISCVTNTAYDPGLAGATVSIPPSESVFAPPYLYTMDATINVPNVVTNGAGVNKGPFAP